jgi:ABC-type transport system involved in multi-copper enzyme maturation permease subunit
MLFPVPLIRRELAALARRRSEYPVRTVGLAILLLVLGLVWMEQIRYGGSAFTSQQLARVGRGLLIAFNITMTSVLILVVPAAMAGALAGEREEKSLDLLRMTPLGAFQIVLSKLLARLGSVTLWVVLAAPFVLVPLFFGGVTPADAWIAVLYPIGAAAWMASAALLASALANRTLTAALATYIGTAAWHALVAILLIGAFDIEEESLHLLPVVAYWIVPVASMEGGAGFADSFLWVVPIETLAFLILCVGVAAWRIRRESEKRGASEARASKRAGARPAEPGRPADPGGRRRVWGHAVAWKEMAAEAGSGTRRLLGLGLFLYVGGFLMTTTVELKHLSALVAGAAGGLVVVAGILGAVRPRWQRSAWSFALLVAAVAGALVVRVAAGYEMRNSRSYAADIPVFLVGLSACVAVAGGGMALLRKSWRPLLVAALPFFFLLVPVFRPDRIDDDLFLGGLFILAIYISAMAPLLAASAVAGERKRGTLESLLLTPLSAGRILSGKALGIWAALAPGLLVMAVQCAVLAALYRPEAVGILLASGVFLAWLGLSIEFGLFLSAVMRKTVHAILIVMGSILLYVAGIPFFTLVSAGGRDAEVILYINPAFWFGYSLADFRASRSYWPGPIDSFAGFLVGYLFFVTVCMSAAALFRWLAMGCVRESVDLTPVPVPDPPAAAPAPPPAPAS